MNRVLRALGRGFLLRCPACGRGRVYRSLFSTNEGCVECSHIYQRDPGDWTGSAEIAIILGYAAGIVAYFALLTVPALSATERFVGAAAATGLAILFFYRHVKGAWVGLMYLWEGPVRVENPLNRAAREPERAEADGTDTLARHRFNVRR